MIAHNIRSTYNIGSILRTADGFGVTKVYCTGYTPYPTLPKDTRLPHLRDKITAQIHKTALGAELLVTIGQSDNILPLLKRLKANGSHIIALEQSVHAVSLPNFVPTGNKIVLLLGEEVRGTPAQLLDICDTIVEIPMRGKKESFNVSVAAGIALYALTHHTT